MKQSCIQVLFLFFRPAFGSDIRKASACPYIDLSRISLAVRLSADLMTAHLKATELRRYLA